MKSEEQEYIKAAYYYKAMYNGPRDDIEEGVLLIEKDLVLVSSWDGRGREQDYHLFQGEWVKGELELALKGTRFVNSETDYRDAKRINLPTIIKDYDLNQRIDNNYLISNKINLRDLVEATIEVAKNLNRID